MFLLRGGTAKSHANGRPNFRRAERYWLIRCGVRQTSVAPGQSDGIAPVQHKDYHASRWQDGSHGRPCESWLVMTRPCIVAMSCAAVAPPCSGAWSPRCSAAPRRPGPRRSPAGAGGRPRRGPGGDRQLPDRRGAERQGRQRRDRALRLGALGDQPPGRTLISEFGLSMHVESRRGDEVRHVLVDYGFTPEALVNNTASWASTRPRSTRSC